MFQLPPLDEVQPPTSSSIKCTKCEKITDHEWVKIQPHVEDLNSIEPMDLLKMTKRLSICTTCGTMRLTN